jgi:peptide/nickel transport system permease protein
VKTKGLTCGGGIFLGGLILLALAVPYLGLPNPTAQDLANQYQGFSKMHWLGQGENGVDVLSQLAWGARLSLGIALGSVAISALIGLLLGSCAGYLRGIWDDLLVRLIEVLQAFPGILLIVTLAVLLGPSVRNLMIAMVATSWTSYARLARALTLSLREREFIQAGIAVGASKPRILFRHIWPNLGAALFVQMTYGVGAAVMTESSLSYLGLGAPPGTPSWGQMLNQGREVILSASHVILVPATALVLTILALNFLGDGLRDYLDPKTLKQT